MQKLVVCLVLFSFFQLKAFSQTLLSDGELEEQQMFRSVKEALEAERKGEKVYKLNLSYSMLVKVPDSIENLVHLQELYLHRNEIKRLPNRMKKLINLQVLDMWDNQLSSIPKIVSELPVLQDLNLSYNNISVHSVKVGAASNLQNLNLEGNSLSETQIDQLKQKLPNCNIKY